MLVHLERRNVTLLCATYGQRRQRTSMYRKEGWSLVGILYIVYYCILSTLYMYRKEGWLVSWLGLCTPSHPLLNTGYTAAHHPRNHPYHPPIYHPPIFSLRAQNPVQLNQICQIPLKSSCNFCNRLFILSRVKFTKRIISKANNLCKETRKKTERSWAKRGRF